MYTTLQINFQKPDRVSVTMEQPPAGLVNQSPIKPAAQLSQKTHLFFANLSQCDVHVYSKSLHKHKHKIQTEAP